MRLTLLDFVLSVSDMRLISLDKALTSSDFWQDCVHSDWTILRCEYIYNFMKIWILYSLYMIIYIL